MNNAYSRIQQLPLYLANQIAAGEVIERPASIVKELLENSLDAGATEITIEVLQGGIDGIRIQDNGCGIHPDDMLLALSPHATSKIKSSEDLEKIVTLGFRGEALASISAVSELTIISAQSQQSHAWQVKVHGREITPTLQPAAHPVGTSVNVQKLFYHTPARRKFLRSARTEWQYMIDMIHRIVLSHFDVEFSIYHNAKKIAHYPKTSAAARIAKVLNHHFIEVAHAINADATHLNLWGFVAPSDFTRSSHDWQYFYLNGRMVKDKLIQHALRQAFGDSLHPGRYAAYVLYLTLDPTQVDVNVHPTKHEVRFHHTRWVHDFIVKSLQEVLSQKTLAPLRKQNPLVYASPLKQMTPRKTGDFLTVLQQQLIISKTEEGLGLIDLHAYFAYQAQQLLQQHTLARQPLLSPQAFKVNAAQETLLLAQQENWQRLGFGMEPMGEQHWILREIPAILARADLIQLITIISTQAPEVWLTQLSCAAIPDQGVLLSPQEIEEILTQVAMLPENTCCPQGQLIWQPWSLVQMRNKSPRLQTIPV